MTVTHSDILSMRLGEFKDIPPLPVGTYVATIASAPKIDKFGQKQNLGAEFAFKLNSPQDDVDRDDLAASGGVPSEPMTYTFWLTPKAAPMIQAFFNDVLDITGCTIPEACMQSVGSQCLVTIAHGTSKKNKDRKFAQIDGFAKLD